MIGYIMKTTAVAFILFLSAVSLAQSNPPASAPVTAIKKPLLFAVVDNELKIDTPRVSYNLDKKSKDNSLVIGNLTFNNQSLMVHIENTALHVKWDQQLIASGTITMTNIQGQKLWSEQLSEGQTAFTGFAESQAINLKSKNKLRFCLRSENPSGYTSLCSQWYQVKIKDNTTTLNPLTKKNAKARIIFQNKPQPAKASIEVNYGSAANFLATLNTDATYIFVSEPTVPVVTDMIVSADDTNKISLLVNNTQIETPRAAPEIHLVGKSGGVFTYPLQIKDPPEQSDRHYATEKTITETYLPSDKIAVIDNNGNQKFIDVELNQKNNFNTVSLDVKGKELTHKSYFEVYRGLAHEANLRLTGLSGSNTVLLVEGALSWWFNDIFASQNYHFSKLRWGVTAKVFNSLNELSASNSTTNNEVSLNSAQLDLRYRFTPGLWLKTPTFGLIGSYESVRIGGTTAPVIGLGGFWLTPMPKAVDNYLNRLSYLNHPKWINLEFIQYLTSTDSNIDLGTQYALNVHGKMLFAEQYVAEAGVGLKKYHFTEKTSLEGASLSMFYATVGLGLTF